MNFKNIIRQIAKEHGVTPAEVKKDMQEAITAFALHTFQKFYYVLLVAYYFMSSPTLTVKTAGAWARAG